MTEINRYSTPDGNFYEGMTLPQRPGKAPNRRLIELFINYDKDGNGVLSRDEIDAASLSYNKKKITEGIDHCIFGAVTTGISTLFYTFPHPKSIKIGSTLLEKGINYMTFGKMEIDNVHATQKGEEAPLNKDLEDFMKKNIYYY